MKQRRIGVQTGSRTARSLGARDPRWDKNARAATLSQENEAPPIVIGKDGRRGLSVASPLYVDSSGRLAIRLGDGVSVIGGRLILDLGVAPEALDDETTGSTGDGTTLTDVGATHNQDTLNDNFAVLAAKVNELASKFGD
jgi:hypothetical protein